MILLVREHLDASAGRDAVGAQAREIKLSRVGDPGRPMQRAVGAVAPPQPEILLARVNAPWVS